MSDRGGTVLIIAVVVAVWFWQGDPARDVRRLFGQQTYEDQSAALAEFALGNKVGSSKDVWLVKRSFVPERVALFFGYMDDWGACYEFQTLYVQRYPMDSYACEYAN